MNQLANPQASISDTGILAGDSIGLLYPAITNLSLIHARFFTNEAYEEFVTILLAHTNLKTLILHERALPRHFRLFRVIYPRYHLSLKSLTLLEPLPSNEIICLLAGALNYNRTLERMTFSVFGLGENGVKLVLLFQQAAYLKTLRIISRGYLTIGDQFVLADMFRRTKTLTTLHANFLSQLKYGSEQHCIFAALERNTSLNTLNDVQVKRFQFVTNHSLKSEILRIKCR